MNRRAFFATLFAPLAARALLLTPPPIRALTQGLAQAVDSLKGAMGTFDQSLGEAPIHDVFEKYGRVFVFAGRGLYAVFPNHIPDPVRLISADWNPELNAMFRDYVSLERYRARLAELEA